MRQTTEIGTGETITPAHGIFTAGRPGWYAIVVLSFVAVEFNPLAALALALGRLAPREVYSTSLGTALTAGSFMLALLGFGVTGRIAFVERNQHALELSSILAFAAGALAFAVGWTLTPIVMWPVAAAFLVPAIVGIRAAEGLPDPRLAATKGDDARRREPDHPSPAPGKKSGRRKRRKRARPRAPRGGESR